MLEEMGDLFVNASRRGCHDGGIANRIEEFIFRYFREG